MQGVRGTDCVHQQHRTCPPAPFLPNPFLVKIRLDSFARVSHYDDINFGFPVEDARKIFFKDVGNVVFRGLVPLDLIDLGHKPPAAVHERAAADAVAVTGSENAFLIRVPVKLSWVGDDDARG